MANKVPKRYLDDIYKRANYSCEICGTTTNITKPHHIVKRRHRNHRPDNQISVCIKCHGGLEQEREDKAVDYQLKLALQEYYLKYYEENKVKQLMGGRFFIGELNNPIAINHYKKIDKLYKGKDFQ